MRKNVDFKDLSLKHILTKKKKKKSLKHAEQAFRNHLNGRVMQRFQGKERIFYVTL